MKRVVILLVALFVQSCSNEQAENDWKKEKLKGKVKSYSEFTFEAIERFDRIEKGMLSSRTYHTGFQQVFDKRGKLIERNIYNFDGSLKLKMYYEYDKKVNNIQINRYNSDGNYKGYSTPIYDDKGNMIEYISYSANGELTNKETFEHNTDGYLVEYKSYSANDSLTSKILSKYDEKGNKIEQIRNLYTVSNYDTKTTYKYNNQSRIIEENIYKIDGGMKYKYTYKYDDNGNIIERNTLNFDTIKTYENNIYDKIFGDLDYINTYKYDYDKRGNWVKQIEFKNGIPKYIVERKYEYF